MRARKGWRENQGTSRKEGWKGPRESGSATRTGLTSAGSFEKGRIAFRRRKEYSHGGKKKRISGIQRRKGERASWAVTALKDCSNCALGGLSQDKEQDKKRLDGLDEGGPGVRQSGVAKKKKKKKKKSRATRPRRRTKFESGSAKEEEDHVANSAR